jgi:hypothetical protein
LALALMFASVSVSFLILDRTSVGSGSGA